ncbi:hypothetical protein DPEC_G00030760 [Dallia pectoralis]|uniref:Uncharacterized protein n=1 Tax=Dallia pectoralis TaxID=75939 RepID=A0ACC2HCC1_DALPE|nr:hypothetical protein DPEC_G00030760 [Dallia pectoralis]
MATMRVAVRVRPLNKREKEMSAKVVIRMEGTSTSIDSRQCDRKWISNSIPGHGLTHGTRHSFSYDFSYNSSDASSSQFVPQQKVFNDLGCDVIEAAFEGYNACVFAYGQTGSGKSYTMIGNQGDLGLIPRICEGLFCQISEKSESEGASFRTEVSYLEIYNERVRDLLMENLENGPGRRVREHPKHGPYVEDLSKHLVQNYSDVEKLMHAGNSSRTTARTGMNDTSSRSHAIFTINFTQARFDAELPCETVSKVHLVDLAGSERANATCATETRLKEGANINKSLVTLGNVISALAEISVSSGSDCVGSPRTRSQRLGKKKKQLFIPYRDSLLTWLLKDSLGGNAKTIMIATISPADVNYSETLSTLRYANRAKNIINTPTINEDRSVLVIRELQEEITRLKRLVDKNQLDLSKSLTVEEKLHQNEAKVLELTKEWTKKWGETQKILKEETVALRKEGIGVVLDSELPHLIGIDDDLLSTGLILYHLREGRTLAGRYKPMANQHIVLYGSDLHVEHCVFENRDGAVTLTPQTGALCSVNGFEIVQACLLTQGAIIQLGRGTMFRFNHPKEAAQLREKRKSMSMTDLSKSTKNQGKLMLFCPGLGDGESEPCKQHSGSTPQSLVQSRMWEAVPTTSSSSLPLQRLAGCAGVSRDPIPSEIRAGGSEPPQPGSSVLFGGVWRSCADVEARQRPCSIANEECRRRLQEVRSESGREGALPLLAAVSDGGLYWDKRGQSGDGDGALQPSPVLLPQADGCTAVPQRPEGLANNSPGDLTGPSEGSRCQAGDRSHLASDSCSGGLFGAGARCSGCAGTSLGLPVSHLQRGDGGGRNGVLVEGVNSACLPKARKRRSVSIYTQTSPSWLDVHAPRSAKRSTSLSRLDVHAPIRAKRSTSLSRLDVHAPSRAERSAPPSWFDVHAPRRAERSAPPFCLDGHAPRRAERSASQLDRHRRSEAVNLPLKALEERFSRGVIDRTRPSVAAHRENPDEVEEAQAWKKLQVAQGFRLDPLDGGISREDKEEVQTVPNQGVVYRLGQFIRRVSQISRLRGEPEIDSQGGQGSVSGKSSLVTRGVSWMFPDAGRFFRNSTSQVLQQVSDGGECMQSAAVGGVSALQPDGGGVGSEASSSWSSQVVSMVRESQVVSLVKDSQALSLVRESQVYSLVRHNQVFIMVSGLPLMKLIQSEFNHVLQKIHSPLTQDLQKIHSPLTQDLQKIHSPLTQDLQKIHSPLTQDLQKIHSPLTQDLQKIHSPLTQDLQKIHGPLTQDLQKIHGPLTQDLQKIHGPLTQDLQKIHGPLTQDLQKIHGPLTQDLQKIHGPLTQDLQKIHGPLTQDLQKIHDPLTQDLQMIHNPLIQDLQPSQSTGDIDLSFLTAQNTFLSTIQSMYPEPNTSDLGAVVPQNSKEVQVAERRTVEHVIKDHVWSEKQPRREDLAKSLSQSLTKEKLWSPVHQMVEEHRQGVCNRPQSDQRQSPEPGHNRRASDPEKSSVVGQERQKGFPVYHQRLVQFPEALVELQSLSGSTLLACIQYLIPSPILTSENVVALYWLCVSNCSQPRPYCALVLLLKSCLYALTLDPDQATPTDKASCLIVFHHLPVLQIKEIQVGFCGQSLRISASSPANVLTLYTHSQTVTQTLTRTLLEVLSPEVLEHPLLTEDLMRLSLDWMVRVPELQLDSGLRVTCQFHKTLADLVYILHGNMDREKPCMGEVKLLLYTSVGVTTTPDPRPDSWAQLLLTDTHLALVQEDAVFHRGPTPLTSRQTQFREVSLRCCTDVRCVVVRDGAGKSVGGGGASGPGVVTGGDVVMATRVDVVMSQAWRTGREGRAKLGAQSERAAAVGASGCGVRGVAGGSITSAGYNLCSPPLPQHAEVWKLTFSCSSEAACLINHLSNI